MKKFLILIIIVIAIASVIFSFGLKFSRESEAAGLLPFGGRILNVTYCTCSGGILLTVGPPRPGNYYFTIGSMLYSYYQIYRPGPWVLGDAYPGGACVVYIGDDCVGAPTTGTIRQVGTSLR